MVGSIDKSDANANRIKTLESELDKAVYWRDVYLRERNEERATFMRRAGELWQPLYDRAVAQLKTHDVTLNTKHDRTT